MGKTLTKIRAELRAHASPQKREGLMRFFKTGKGEYGEGDRFIGVMVPQTRAVVKKYLSQVTDEEILQLLHSKIHEERLAALLMFVEKYKRAELEKEKKAIYSFYLKNIDQVNNWDLVDLSAPRIVGEWTLAHGDAPLFLLARSKNMWKRRIAMVSTFSHIRAGRLDVTLTLAKQFLGEQHDLMHKATGWALREVGKKDRKTLEQFLDTHGKSMPRTMLRYAIERLPENKRIKYLQSTL